MLNDLVELYKRKDYELLGLYPKQIKAIELLNRAYSDSELSNGISINLVYGGSAGGGKSHIGCTWLLFNCLAYPDSRWFVGRETLKSIKDTVLESFHLTAKLYDLKSDKDYVYNAQEGAINFKNGSKISFLQLEYVPRDPLYEDLGSLQFTGGWIEEAGEINFNAFDTLKSRVNRWKNFDYKLAGCVLITCNPKKNWLYDIFYNPYRNNKLAPENYFIPAFVDDNEHNIKSGYKQTLEGITDVAKKERLLYGNWDYESNPNQLCERKKIIDLFSNSFVKESNERYISADIATLGSDYFRVGVWYGHVLKHIYSYPKSAGKEIVSIIQQIRYKHQIPESNFIYDSDGIGMFLAGDSGYFPNAVSFHANATPIKYEGEREEFQNLKAQCGFRLAEMINGNKIYIEYNGLSEEEKNMLIAELELLENYNSGTDKKLALPPKDKMKAKIKRSPDFLDMMLMRIYFDLDFSFDYF